MADDRTLDRRSFLAGASAAGLAGFAGIGPLRSRARGDGEGDESRTGGGTNGQTGRVQNGAGTGEGDGGIETFRMVLPSRDILEGKPIYKIVVVGGPIQPGVRPPPVCFPQGVDQWFARDAVVVKPTETTGLFGGDDGIGAVNRSRAYLERRVEPGTVYRIAEGQYCDGYVRATVHELPPRLSEYFSLRMVENLEALLRGVGDEPAGNGTGTNATAGTASATETASHRSPDAGRPADRTRE